MSDSQHNETLIARSQQYVGFLIYVYVSKSLPRFQSSGPFGTAANQFTEKECLDSCMLVVTVCNCWKHYMTQAPPA